MMQLELMDEDAVVLSQILTGELRRLATEIAHTDHREFREILRERARSLERILARLPLPVGTA